MSLSKLIHIFRSFMVRRRSRSGRLAAIENLRVQLIPAHKEKFDIEAHRKVVQQLISMMVLNLKKRGRPRKEEEGVLNHAI